MSKRFIPMFVVVLLLFLVTVGCGLSSIPGLVSQPGVVEDAQATQVFQAAEGTATQLAVEAELANILTQTAVPMVQEPSATNTAAPSATVPIPSDTPVPLADTATPLPPTATQTPILPSATLTRTNTPIVVIPPTATPIPCNAAKFVADVTIPDGTVFLPNSSFTKTWRIKNVGTCTWNMQYDLVFYNGSQMSAPGAVDFPASVAPGQEVDLSVNLTAPKDNGTYRSNWKLRDDKGMLFGLGATSVSFYADIKVSGVSSSKYALDLATSYCTATWKNGSNTLTCPSPDNDSRGFVKLLTSPKLETGQIDDEPGVLTNPQVITDGYIQGTYPSVRVENGYHFKSIVGCEYNATSCSVKFQLQYRIGDGSVETLGSWNETYEGNFTKVDVDLSSLAGKDVKFILTVSANGSSNGDRALWLHPRITKP